MGQSVYEESPIGGEIDNIKTTVMSVASCRLVLLRTDWACFHPVANDTVPDEMVLRISINVFFHYTRTLAVIRIGPSRTDVLRCSVRGALR